MSIRNKIRSGRRHSRIVAAIAVCMGLVMRAKAATVGWGTVTTITAASDIDSSDMSDIAGANFGITTGTTTIVNNGTVDVEFKSLNSGQNVTLANGINVAAASAWENWGENNGSNIGGTFETVLDYNLGIEGATSATITLSGLTLGTTYRIQFFIDSTGSNTQTISGSANMNSLNGQFVTGTFTADATSQELTVTRTTDFGVANALTIGTVSGGGGEGDTTPPTVVSMVDDVSGGPIYENTTVVNYTVTFSEPMDGATVTSSAFDNAGTASISVGTVEEVSTMVFTVPVSLLSTGTLQLRIPSGSVINDSAANALAVPVLDDTTITINPGLPPAIGTWIAQSGNWSTPGNWLDNFIPDTVGATALFTYGGLTGNRTFTIDNASRTLGTLTLGENKSCHIASTGGAVLILDNNGSPSQVTQLFTAGNNFYIDVPIHLKGPLNIANERYNDSGKHLNFGVITNITSGGVTVTNNEGTKATGGTVNFWGVVSDGTNGTLSIVQDNKATSSIYALTLGAANTYSGMTMLKSGYLNLQHAHALQNSTLVMEGGRLLLHASVVTAYTLGGLSAATSGLGYDIALENTAGGAVVLAVGGNGSNTTYAAVLSGVGSLKKTGAGTLTLSGSNTYTGLTTVAEGTLALGANNALADATPVSMGNGTLAVATYTDTVGTLSVTGEATLNLGEDGMLAFADSKDMDWTGGTLTITGAFVSGASLRFGDTDEALTPEQLKKITSPADDSFILNSNGYLILGKKYGTIIRLN